MEKNCWCIRLQFEVAIEVKGDSGHLKVRLYAQVMYEVIYEVEVGGIGGCTKPRLDKS